MTPYTTGTGQVLTNTHDAGKCMGAYCALHHPMPGPWELWPTNWNTLRRIMERVCPCGYYHPAAEEYQFHNYSALTHRCCKVPWHRCAPELQYDQFIRFGFHDPDSKTIDGEIVENVKELEA